MKQKDKTEYVATVYPQISKKGREYLKNIAQAMLKIQEPGSSPIPSKFNGNTGVKKPASGESKN